MKTIYSRFANKSANRFFSTLYRPWVEFSAFRAQLNCAVFAWLLKLPIFSMVPIMFLCVLLQLVSNRFGSKIDVPSSGSKSAWHSRRWPIPHPIHPSNPRAKHWATQHRRTWSPDRRIPPFQQHQTPAHPHIIPTAILNHWTVRIRHMICYMQMRAAHHTSIFDWWTSCGMSDAIQLANTILAEYGNCIGPRCKETARREEKWT